MNEHAAGNHGWNRSIRAAALAILAVLVGIVVIRSLIGSLETRLTFFPYGGEDDTPATLGVRYSRITIETADGERLAAWQLEPERPVADIVYFHGNGGNLSLWLPVLATLHGFDYRVLAVDYRGYGLSTGSPTEAGVYLDAEATVRRAVQHRAKDRPLVFWGRSLGGPIAASATRTVVPDGLILESAFPDKAAVIRSQPVLRALNVFGAYRFPTSELLRDFRRPVLVMHGDDDRVVPFALGQELYESLAAPKEFRAVRGAGHNDLFDPGRADYWSPITDFINRLRQ